MCIRLGDVRHILTDIYIRDIDVGKHRLLTSFRVENLRMQQVLMLHSRVSLAMVISQLSTCIAFRKSKSACVSNVIINLCS
jgi:hypothetical protein